MAIDRVPSNPYPMIGMCYIGAHGFNDHPYIPYSRQGQKEYADFFTYYDEQYLQ